MHINVTYRGSTTPWLRDFHMRTQRTPGNLPTYVFMANSDVKRSEDIWTGSGRDPGGVYSVSVGITRSSSPLDIVELEFVFDEAVEYSATVWEYRYGPTILLVPVRAILSAGEPVPFATTDRFIPIPEDLNGPRTTL